MPHISENIQEVAKHFISQPMGYSTGFKDLDESLWGIHPKTLMMIGARPSMGKSSIMADLALAVSKEVPVGVFSKEMGGHQFPPRLACNLAKLNYHRVKKGDISDREKDEYFAAMDEVSKLPIYVDYDRYIIGDNDYWITARKSSEPNIESYILDTQIKHWVQEQGVKVIFVDYLQILDLLDRGIKDQRLKVGKMAEILRDYAKQYNITMVLLSQLRRFDQSQGRVPVPRMSDLQESGQLEAHSDTILLLHRPSYYDDEKELGMFEDRYEDDAAIILAKNRDGDTGNIKVDFCAYAMSYVDKKKPDLAEIPF